MFYLIVPSNGLSSIYPPVDTLITNWLFIFEFIEDNGTNLKDLRGQPYDNTSDMSGKYNDMQAMMKERNHQADYIPCVAHSLNLVGK